VKNHRFRSHPTDPSRRDFLKTSTVSFAGIAAGLSKVPAVHAGGSDVVRVGLIGCGRRGTGAATQALNADLNVKLIAMGDLFADHLVDSLSRLKKDEAISAKVDVKEDHCFIGWDAYEKVLATSVDVVLLTSPPHFRPAHLKAAIAAGKHVFCEKPIAVDATGVRAVLDACDEAKKKNLSLVSGLCYRYEHAKRETMQRVHDGAIGEIQALHTTYNTGGLWKESRQPHWSDMEWQVRNWLYFTWLSGDHIVEQHIHSLDKMAWAMKDEYPAKAVGTGGRQVRVQPEYGHIFDHHAVVFEYRNGVKLFSFCRQQDGCAKDVSDSVIGTEGTCDVMKHAIRGKHAWRYRSRDGTKDDMYQNEHDELFASIRSGKPINNGDYMCKSTLMAIMGRMATYTGQVITWEHALNSKEDLSPPKYEFGPIATPAVALPGKTRLV
jgi:myo-inositol 2-dehydrogenase / D-chiro-inositol 1-dehydrogenase